MNKKEVQTELDKVKADDQKQTTKINTAKAKRLIVR